MLFSVSPLSLVTIALSGAFLPSTSTAQNIDASINSAYGRDNVPRSSREKSRMAAAVSAAFSKVGDGYCLDGSGQYYSAFKSSALPLDTPDSYCLDWCDAIMRPDLVAVEISRTNGVNTFCYCDFPGGIPQDISLTDFNPAAGTNIYGPADGPVVSVSSEQGATCYANTNYSPATDMPTFSPTLASTPCIPFPPPIASKVKIQSNTANVIQLNEVEVLSDGANVALGKTATQGSTYKNRQKFSASKAIDGDLTTFSHTDRNGCNWLEIDLGASLFIEGVKLHNRACRDNDAAFCLCRLSFATVSLLDEDGLWVDGTLLGDTCGQLEVSHFFTNCPLV